LESRSSSRVVAVRQSPPGLSNWIIGRLYTPGIGRNQKFLSGVGELRFVPWACLTYPEGMIGLSQGF
jgi:hypothetical protein